MITLSRETEAYEDMPTIRYMRHSYKITMNCCNHVYMRGVVHVSI